VATAYQPSACEGVHSRRSRTVGGPDIATSAARDSTQRHDRPPLRPDRHRQRAGLHPLIEAAARVAFAYWRNQYGLRSRRPLLSYLTKSAFFLVAGPFLERPEARMSGLRVTLSGADRTIARSVFASGDWDPLLVGAAFEALDLWGHDYRGRTMVEVGANFGVYCLPAVVEYGFGRAIAYEPEPDAFALLTANVEGNDLDDRVTVVQAALSRQPGELLLRRGRTNAGDNRIVGGFADDDRRTVAVRATTFDDEVAAGAIRLDEVGLLWLDVQGHELDVLAGASSLLAANVPVLIEYETSKMSDAGRAELDQLIAANFSAFVDLGWSALTNRIRFQPAAAIGELAPGRAVETDLLLL
jgi:FkbM family methyltransferase